MLCQFFPFLFNYRISLRNPWEDRLVTLFTSNLLAYKLITSEKCFDEFIYRTSSVLSKERRTNDAEKYVYTKTRSKILPADAEHPFAFIRLR